MRSIYAVLLTCLLAASAFGQHKTNLFPGHYWYGDDPSSFTSGSMSYKTDSQFAYMAPGSRILYNFPQPEGEFDVDSIAVVGQLSDGLEIVISTSHDTNNLWVNATLKGPLSYGYHWLKFQKPPYYSAKYLQIEVPIYSSNDELQSGQLQLDAVVMSTHLSFTEDVAENSTAIENVELWYSFPLMQFTGLEATMPDARRRLLPGLYVTNHGKKYRFGR